MHERLAWKDVSVLGAEARSTNVLLNEPMAMRSSLDRRSKPQGRTITTVHGRRGAGSGRMIPTAYIDAWRARAPWPEPHQVEHDLILSRTIVDIFSSEALGSRRRGRRRAGSLSQTASVSTSRM